MPFIKAFPYGVLAGARIPHPHTCPNGPSWSDRAIPQAKWAAIASGNGLFVAGGGNPNIFASPPCYSVSHDFGQTWSAMVTLPAEGGAYVQPNSLAYGAGLFVALIGATVNQVSPDGVAWEDTATPVDDKFSLYFANGVFLWLTGTNRSAYRSVDGRNWFATTLPNLGDNSWSFSCFDEKTGRWIAISNSWSAYSVDNGATWIAGGALPRVGYFGLSCGGGKTVAVYGAGSAVTVDYSLDGGLTWHTANFPTGISQNYRTTLFRQGVFLVFSVNGDVVWVSPDAVNWKVADKLSKFTDSSDSWSTAGDANGHYAGVATSSNSLGSLHAAVGVC